MRSYDAMRVAGGAILAISVLWLVHSGTAEMSRRSHESALADIRDLLNNKHRQELEVPSVSISSTALHVL